MVGSCNHLPHHGEVSITHSNCFSEPQHCSKYWVIIINKTKCLSSCSFTETETRSPSQTGEQVWHSSPGVSWNQSITCWFSATPSLSPVMTHSFHNNYFPCSIYTYFWTLFSRFHLSSHQSLGLREPLSHQWRRNNLLTTICQAPH